MKKTLGKGDTAPDFSLQDSNQNKINIKQFNGKSFALLFTRYVGCPVCQMDTINYARHYETFKEQGLELAVVFQSSPDRLREFTDNNQLPFITLSDTKRSAYRAYGVQYGLTGLLSPKNLPVLARTIKAGHRHGKFEGNEFQYPAAFLIDSEQKILHSHYGSIVTDSVSPPELLSIYKRLTA